MDDKFQEDDAPEEQPEEKFQTAFPNPADVPSLRNPEGFQSAFPEDTGMGPVKEELLCIHGCGRAAKFGNLRASEFHSQPGDPPRCEKNMSDCPAVNRKAIRAAKRDGRLGRRWISRF
jgi:hypothetical protein